MRYTGASPTPISTVMKKQFSESFNNDVINMESGGPSGVGKRRTSESRKGNGGEERLKNREGKRGSASESRKGSRKGSRSEGKRGSLREGRQASPRSLALSCDRKVSLRTAVRLFFVDKILRKVAVSTYRRQFRYLKGTEYIVFSFFFFTYNLSFFIYHSVIFFQFPSLSSSLYFIDFFSFSFRRIYCLPLSSSVMIASLDPLLFL